MRRLAPLGHLVPLLAPLLLVACGGGTDVSTPGDPEPRFAFALLADPHLYGSAEAEGRLQAAADWLAAHGEARDLRLVFVLGDLGSRRDRVRAVLDPLPVPWIPVLGDNAIQGGEETAFDADLAPHRAALAATLDGWHEASRPVGGAWLQDFAFDHEGVHFVGLDWCTRVVGGLEGEQADLHDVPGGTLPFLAAELDTCLKPRRENVVLLSHHPMHAVLGGAGAFAPEELARVESVTAPWRDHVYADFAGHYHFAWHDGEGDGGFEVFVLDAVHDDDVTLRLVEVLDDGAAFTYRHQTVVVPWDGP